MAEGQPIPVRVLGIRIAKRALDGNSGPGLVATLDMTVPGFSLFGVGLYRQGNGHLMVATPQSRRHDGTASGIRIDHDALRETMLKAACDAARVFGANVDPAPAGA